MSSPSGKKHRSSHQHHSSGRSHHQTRSSYEPEQPYYPTSRYSSRNPYESRAQPYYVSSTRQSSSHIPPNITTLPTELKHMIVSDLDPVTSACLGLASKSYYPVHRSHHSRRIDLYEQAHDRRLPLAMYLKDWVPKDQGLDWRSGRFMRREKLPEYERDMRERERWEGRLRRSKIYRRMDVGRYRW